MTQSQHHRTDTHDWDAVVDPDFDAYERHDLLAAWADEADDDTVWH